MRDARTKAAFIDYLNDPRHAEERFWQALRNFSEFDLILGWSLGEFDKDGTSTIDTFYLEADKRLGSRA